MFQPNVSYFHNNSSMNTHPQKQHNKKRKNPTGRKERCYFFMNNAHIIMHNTSISYLNGLIIIIIFFQ